MAHKEAIDAWRIVPGDRVRSRIDPRHTGVAQAIVNGEALIEWDDSGWLEAVDVDDLHRIHEGEAS